MGKSQYPRGAPFKSPESEGKAPDASLLEARLREIQQREAHLQRWMIQVALGTVLVVVVTVGTGVFFVHRALRRADTPVATHPEEVRDRIIKDTKPSAVLGAGSLPLPRDPLPRDPATTPRERSLEAIGGLTAAHLYQSYLNIGMLADAAENDVYGDEDSRKLLTTILAWMKNVDQQLAILAEANLEAEDQKKVAQVRQLTGLLRTQAEELRAYWETPEADKEVRKDHEMKFHQAREAAWVGIKQLLGLKDE
jgi:hypothetical protein